MATEVPPKPTFTNVLNIERYTNDPIMPAYRVMDSTGRVIDPSQDPNVGQEMAVKMYQVMLKLNIMDSIMYDVQRQGRISFYMTSIGEEATHIGSSAALEPSDEIFAQYREAGTLIWRGFTLEQCIDQCFSNENDLGKGRQMPVHYGSKSLCFQTISSPLGTQIPQASGAAYGLKILNLIKSGTSYDEHENSQDSRDFDDRDSQDSRESFLNRKLEPLSRCVICYFGDGAASEGDFHPALNFASTLDCPIIFFCRNNGYAISTPVREQYRGDGIASRGKGYGIDTVRVDGNDIWAVYNVTKRARHIAVTEHRPVIIEAMTYRVGHHSTSDDSTRYRTRNETDYWMKEDNPITRLRKYLEHREWWSNQLEVELKQKTRAEVISLLNKAEMRKKPPIDDLFTDVYDELPPNLLRQREQLHNHLKKWKHEYPNNFKSE